jgi:hypothetical protein
MPPDLASSCEFSTKSGTNRTPTSPTNSSRRRPGRKHPRIQICHGWKKRRKPHRRAAQALTPELGRYRQSQRKGIHEVRTAH